MTRPVSRRNPLEGTTQLLVDGTNLLYALTRGSGHDRQPPAAVIGRLRGAIPPEAKIVLVFDGQAERGVRGERIAGGLTVQYSGRYSADTILVTLVEDAALMGEDTAHVLVVTDDRALGEAIRKRGARTAHTNWLIGRMDRPRLSSPSIGNARPPTPPRLAQQRPGEATTDENDEDRGAKRWTPGRGATTKKGNARRIRR